MWNTFRKKYFKIVVLLCLMLNLSALMSCAYSNDESKDWEERENESYSTECDIEGTQRYLEEFEDNIIVAAIDKLTVTVPVDPDSVMLEELDRFVMSLYPEIDWGYIRQSIFMADANYDFPIYYVLKKQDSELNNKKDYLTYSYSFSTYTANISGELLCEFEYKTDEMWHLVNIVELNNECEWNLEGIWSFNMWTYYVDVAISELDLKNNVAQIQYRGDVGIHGGRVMPLELSFTTDGRNIFFETFTINNTGYDYEDVDIVLTAGMSDMFFLMPAMATSGKDTMVGVGGKFSLEKELISSIDVADIDVLSSEEVVAESDRIDKIWVEREKAIKEKVYKGEKLNYWYTAYYDEQNELKLITVPLGHVSRYKITWQIEDNEVTFAFYEGATDSNKLYFKEGVLFKWIYTEKEYGKEINTIIYENEFANPEFLAWQMQVFEDYENVFELD